MGNVADEYIGVTELKNSFPKRLAMLEEGGVDHIFILKHNRPVAVVLALADWEELMQSVDDLSRIAVRAKLVALEPPVEVEGKP